MKWFKTLLMFLLPVFAIIGMPALIVNKGILFSDWPIDLSSYTHLLQPAKSIFLAILIESFPFVLVGALLSSIIHELIPDERLVSWIPRNRLASVLFGGAAGFIVPVCDCGTVPVARSLLQKGVSRSVVIAFTLAAPVVNPITIAATYVAFGMNIRITIARIAAAYLIACLTGFAAGGRRSGNEISSRLEIAAAAHPGSVNKGRISIWSRFRSIVDHMVSELFGIIGFLIISSAVSAIYQVYHTQNAAFGQLHTGIASILVLMSLAILFSLCSQADAFVARSFAVSYPPGALLSFLLIGQTADIRNLSLLPKTFGAKTAAKMIASCLLLSLFAGLIYK